MRSALIVHSNSTKAQAKKLAKKYKNVSFLHNIRMENEQAFVQTLVDEYQRPYHGWDIIGIGGGAVIDMAKIIAWPKPCIAIPTTAAGSACTEFATVWGSRKLSIATSRPYVLMPEFNIKLNWKARRATKFDCLTHAVEAHWAKKQDATGTVRFFANKALEELSLTKNDNDLIIAGNNAGRAINIAKTNVIHATSYPLTTIYGIKHGDAIGMIFHVFYGYFSCNLNIPEMKPIPLPRRVDIEKVATQAMTYGKIQRGPKPITKRILLNILRRC